MAYSEQIGKAFSGAYELFVLGLDAAERAEILRSITEQKHDANKIDHLRLTLLESALLEIWGSQSESQTERNPDT